MVNIKLSFWKNKKVLVTGHTGFKGSWLVSLLLSGGAKVYGISLKPDSNKNLYKILNLNKRINDSFIDILDQDKLNDYFKRIKPEIIFHLAAQPLVIKSIKDPELTFTTNIMGTYNILNCFRNNNKSKVCVIVTSDKCYENNNKNKKFDEKSKLGGDDPYSSSKACAELLVNSFNKTFIAKTPQKDIATVRAGNVIGGGDWGNYRIIPDLIEAIYNNKKLIIRNKNASRPWQHVLDCVYGYLLLAEKIYKNKKFAGAWNFGPIKNNKITVKKIINDTYKFFNIKSSINIIYANNSHGEKNSLYLNSNKSRTHLKWKPKLNYPNSLKLTLEWYKAYYEKNDMNKITNEQIERYFKI